VTETLTPNDKAYIKISQELLRLRNDLSVMQMIPTITSSMNQWHRAKLKEVRVGLHSEGREGWSELLNLISSDTSELESSLQKIKGRIKLLEELSEAYIKGQDIIQLKLARDK
jgi:hypothetical protein